MSKKQFNLSVLNNNPYALVVEYLLEDYDEEDFEALPVKVQRRLDRASQMTAEIDKVLDDAATKIKSLKKHRLGIGDTETDENIASDFYSKLHW